jgi:hypothetical protein
MLTPFSPIMNYGEKGVSSPGVVKRQHSIAFTGKEVPKALGCEEGDLRLGGMRPAVRVSWYRGLSTMSTLSRINYGEPKQMAYSEEVQRLGIIDDPGMMMKLVMNWEGVSKERMAR